MYVFLYEIEVLYTPVTVFYVVLREQILHLFDSFSFNLLILQRIRLLSDAFVILHVIHKIQFKTGLAFLGHLLYA